MSHPANECRRGPYPFSGGESDACHSRHGSGFPCDFIAEFERALRRNCPEKAARARKSLQRAVKHRRIECPAMFSGSKGSIGSVFLTKKWVFHRTGRKEEVLERLRRLILLTAVLAAIWLYFLASLIPLVMVEPVDFASKQRKSRPFGFRTEREEQLARLPLDQYISEVTKGRLVRVTGGEWEELFRSVAGVRPGSPVPEALEGHIGPWDLKSRIAGHFFFRPDETPIGAVSDSLEKDNQVLYVGLAGADPGTCLSLTYKVYTDKDFSFGTGFNRIPGPPARYLFPYRNIAFAVIAAGLLLYLFIPAARRNPAVIRYQRWRVCLGDFCLLFLLAAPFFALPILVIGGSMQALTVAWPLTIIVWPIAALAAWALRYMAWSAAYGIEVLGSGLRIYDDGKIRELPYADIQDYQPAVFRPPKWLIFLSWAAALLGQGAAAIGATGRALILSTGEYGGIAVNTRSGRTVFIWVTDQMGAGALAGFNRLIAALAGAHIPTKVEERTVRSIVPVTEA